MRGVWRLAVVLLLVALSVTSKVDLHSVSVTQPTDGGVYMIKSGTSTSVTLAFDHSFTDEQGKYGVAFCFHILKTDSQFKYSENCFNLATKKITINEIGSGEYLLTTFLREFDEELQSASSIISGTTSTRSFKVISNQHSFPLLGIVPPDLCTPEPGQPTSLSFAVNAKTNKASAEVLFTLRKTTQSSSIELFSICLTLLSLDGSVLVKQSCLSPSQHSAVLSNLPVGTYTLQASLIESGSEDVIQSSAITASLQVYSLSSAVQGVNIAGAMATDSSSMQLEYATSSGTIDAPISVSIRTTPCSAEKLVSLCLELYTHGKSDHTNGALIPAGSLLSRKCFPPEVRTLTPRHLAAGLYTAVITLHDARDMANNDSVDSSPSPPLVLPTGAGSSALRVLLETRVMEELEPSYEWQRLHAWHSIPAGMDVRLPIGGTGHKEARIPQPWRLQALLPKGCKGGSFLRMDLYRHSTISDIRKRAESVCRNTAGVYVLYDSNSGEALGPDTATVEEVKLFQRKVHVEYEQPE